MTLTIYHNARCSKSRATLQILHEAEQGGSDVTIINYLETPPSVDELKTLLQQLDMRPAELVRSGEPVYKALNLGDPSVSDEDLIRAMSENPILINRPIVVTEQGSRLCRPPDRVFDILD